MNQAIEKRISRRSFTKESVSVENEKEIRKWITEINEVSGLNIEYVADGSEAFGNIRKATVCLQM